MGQRLKIVILNGILYAMVSNNEIVFYMPFEPVHNINTAIVYLIIAPLPITRSSLLYFNRAPHLPSGSESKAVTLACVPRSRPTIERRELT